MNIDDNPNYDDFFKNLSKELRGSTLSLSNDNAKIYFCLLKLLGYLDEKERKKHLPTYD